MPPPRGNPDDRAARAFVWGVWLAMVVTALVFLVRDTRNVPLTEDWSLVPALTGNEPHFLRSLWEQNNEHRVPLPRLMLLGMLAATHGDFRVGAAFNVAMLAATAALFLRLMRRVRGRSVYADAFLPIVLLHLGHWENLYWSWQLTLILAGVLVPVLLYLFVADPAFERLASRNTAVAALVALPLSGGTGVVFAPFFALWIGYCGLRRRRASAPGGLLLPAAAAVSLVLTGLYFVGYQRPPWVPHNPGVGASLIATTQFVAMGFGPIARSSWVLAWAAAALLLIPAVVLTARALLRSLGPEGRELDRERLLALSIFWIAFGVFALAMGWGRAGVITLYRGWPLRYALLATPAFIAAYVVFELYAGLGLRRIGQQALATAMLVLLPFNAVEGLRWGRYNTTGADAVRSDLTARPTALAVAQRRGRYLNHSMAPDRLAELMLMLKEARIGPWVRLSDPVAGPRSPAPAVADSEPAAVTSMEWRQQRVRYRGEGIAAVNLVWGVDGWHPVGPSVRPPGTFVQRGVLHTPMRSVEGGFEVTLQVPAASTLDYGFSVVTTGLEPRLMWWDGGYRAGSASAVVLEHGSASEWESASGATVPTVRRQVRYRISGAGRVLLNWRVAAEGNSNRGSAGVQRTPMTRVGDWWTAEVRAPVGAALVYRVIVLDRAGILNLVSPISENRWHRTAVPLAAKPIDVPRSVSLPNELRDVWGRRRLWAAGLLLLAGCWAVLYAAAGTGRVASSFSYS